MIYFRLTVLWSYMGNSIVTDVTISETYSPAAAKFINTDLWVYLSETLAPYNIL